MTTEDREIVANLRLMANGLPVSRSKAVASAAADRLEELQIENGKLFADAMNNTNTEAELRKTKRGLSVEIDLLTEKLAAMDERLTAEMSATQDMEGRAMKAERERDAARAACKAFLSDVAGTDSTMTFGQPAIDMLMRNVERMQDALNGGPNAN